MTMGQILQIGMFGTLLVVPIVTIVKIRKHLTGLKSYVLAALVSSFVMSGAVVTQWLVHDWYLESKIAPLDRDGDGMWTNSDMTTWNEEDYRNIESYTGDGGRNVFAAIIFPLFSVLYSLIVVVVYRLVVLVKSRSEPA